MKKQDLLTFISKYNLGSIEAVAWKTKGDTIITKFISDNKTVLGSVKLSNVDVKKSEDFFDEQDYGIIYTSQLVKLLAVMESEITISPNKKSERIVGLTIKSTNKKINYALADLSVIPTIPSLKTIPPMDLEIVIDEQFTDAFIKGKNALPDAHSFTVMSEPYTKIVIGHSNLNSNTVEWSVKTQKTAKIKDVSFKAELFKEILSANKDCTMAIFKVSEKGIGTITFESGDFKSTYYLIAINEAD